MASTNVSFNERVYSSNRKRKTKENSSNSPIKAARFSGTYLHQNWSFPDSLIYFITMNPSSPKLYQKMVKTCKYFLSKNRIYITPELYYYEEKWRTSFIKKPFDMTTALCKFWITDKFYSIPKKSFEQSLFSSINPKIYQCDATYINVASLIITYRDFCFLTPSVEIINMSHVTVKNVDGSETAFEKIVEALPKIQKIYHYSNTVLSNITAKTVENLTKIPYFLTLEWLTLNHIPDIFDIDALYHYIKKNKSSKFNLEFDSSISDAYKKSLEGIVDEILEAKNHDYQPPYIYFRGINPRKLDKLHRIFYKL